MLSSGLNYESIGFDIFLCYISYFRSGFPALPVEAFIKTKHLDMT